MTLILRVSLEPVLVPVPFHVRGTVGQNDHVTIFYELTFMLMWCFLCYYVEFYPLVPIPIECVPISLSLDLCVDMWILLPYPCCPIACDPIPVFLRVLCMIYSAFTHDVLDYATRLV